MTEPKQSFTEEVKKEAESRYRPFYNQSSYDENSLPRTSFIEGANVALSILSRKTEGREFYLGKQVFHTAADAKYLVEECQSKYSEFTQVIEYSALVAERARLAKVEAENASHKELNRKLANHNADYAEENTTLRTQSLNNQTLALEYSKTIDKLEAQLAYLRKEKLTSILLSGFSQFQADLIMKEYDLELQKKGQGDE